MALLFMDGFDHYATADLTAGVKWTATTGSPSISASYKRNGTNGVRLANGAGIEKTLNPGTANSGIVGFAIYPEVNGPIVFVNNADGNQMCLTQESDDTLAVRRGGSSGTIIGTSTAALTMDTWSYVEMKFTLATGTGSTGSVEVRLNGSSSSVINISAVDNKSQTSDGWTQIVFDTAAGTDAKRFDDIYICDLVDASIGNTGPSNDDFLGDVRVVMVLPSTGNGSNTDFTPSTSTDHGALVDDTDADTDGTDYNYSSTVGHIDTYNFPALGVTGTVLGVQLNLSTAKSDTGTREIAAVARPSATNRVGTTQALTTSYVYYREVWDCSPETDDDWTVSEIDGSEFGIKVIT